MTDGCLARLFPMRDAAAAELMMLKAKCLRSAGVIGEVEERLVLTQARDVIKRSALHDAKSRMPVPACPGE